MNVLARTFVPVAALVLSACAAPATPPAPDTRAADEAAIRAKVKEWSAAAQAKDAVKFLSFYADDGVVMLEGAPDMSGIGALREGIPGMMGDPNFALAFEADKVVVARSGDLAYETGSFSMTMSGPDKQPLPTKGHYIVVWRKGADGVWKVVIDAPVSDPA